MPRTEFGSKICCMNSLMYSKNYDTDFCDELVNKLDIYHICIHVPEFKGEFVVSYNKRCSSRTVKYQPSATTAATFARPMSLINFEG